MHIRSFSLAAAAALALSTGAFAATADPNSLHSNDVFGLHGPGGSHVIILVGDDASSLDLLNNLHQLDALDVLLADAGPPIELLDPLGIDALALKAFDTDDPAMVLTFKGKSNVDFHLGDLGDLGGLDDPGWTTCSAVAAMNPVPARLLDLHGADTGDPACNLPPGLALQT